MGLSRLSLARPPGPHLDGRVDAHGLEGFQRIRSGRGGGRESPFVSLGSGSALGEVSLAS